MTDSEARQRLAALLDRATREGAVRSRRRDGQVSVPRPEEPADSPLDVPGVDLDLAVDEIIEAVPEGGDRAGATQALEGSTTMM